MNNECLLIRQADVNIANMIPGSCCICLDLNLGKELICFQLTSTLWNCSQHNQEILKDSIKRLQGVSSHPQVAAVSKIGNPFPLLFCGHNQVIPESRQTADGFFQSHSHHFKNPCLVSNSKHQLRFFALSYYMWIRSLGTDHVKLKTLILMEEPTFVLNSAIRWMQRAL